MNVENAKTEIAGQLEKHHEWLLIAASGKTFALQKDEIEIAGERGKLLFSFVGGKGFQTWRVAGFNFEKQKIHLDLTKNFGAEKLKVELVPRTPAREFSDAVELARIEKANQIARLIVENKTPSKLIRVALNKETGRVAQIVFEIARGRQAASLADVSETLTPEQLLTAAILWIEKLRGRRKNPIENVSILAETKTARKLQKLRALLAENWQKRIEIFELSPQAEKNQETVLKRLANLRISDLRDEKPKKIHAAENTESSETAQKIIALAPFEIDVISARNGETLRFRGLPFARVRKIFGAEKAWFGIDAKQQILSEKNFGEFLELIEDLKIYRRFDSPNKHHVLYARAPENWLESLLRRDIKQLDANLILSPVYNQFRVARERIDLLALRRDGRLIVIELKVAPDREMVFQAAGYWRQIEQMRRAGVLRRARIFGDLEISDAQPLVFLVAPMLGFHRDLEFLSKTIAPEIEIYRYDLSENWRENLKVLRRKSFAGERVKY